MRQPGEQPVEEEEAQHEHDDVHPEEDGGDEDDLRLVRQVRAMQGVVRRSGRQRRDQPSGG